MIELAIAGVTASEHSFLRPGDEPLRDQIIQTLRERLAAGPQISPNFAQRLKFALRTRGTRRTLAAALRKGRALLSSFGKPA